MGKLVLLGLDGADWKILDPLLKEGCLPNLQHIIENGSSARLRSTIPALTPPAWRSIFTGVNPGKHGIFDFVKFVDGNRHTTNSTDAMVPYFWDLINEKILAFNIPCSYPLKKSHNTIIVSGHGTPSKRNQFTYPEGIRDEILELEPNYDFHISEERFVKLGVIKNKCGLYESICSHLKTKKNIAQHLLKTKEWESAIIVFSASDWAQHYFMHEFITEKTKSDTRIAGVYKIIDDFVGYLIDEGHNILVVSDHGFSKLDRVCYPNTYLFNKGLLVLKPDPLPRRILTKLKITQESIYSLPYVIRFFGNLGFFRGLLSKLPMEAILFHRIDLKKTTAYMFSGSGNGFIVRSTEDIDNIAKILKESRDEHGRKMMKAIFKRGEIYRGAALEKAPHIIAVPEDDVLLSTTLYPTLSKEVDPKKNIDGHHDLHGIFISYGKDFQKKDLATLSVNDITPTILAFHGYSQPAFMDGKPVPIIGSTPKKKILETRSSIKALLKMKKSKLMPR